MFCAICLAPSMSVSPVLMRCASPFFSTLSTDLTSPWIMGLLSTKLLLSRAGYCGLTLTLVCTLGSLKEKPGVFRELISN
jgi:hypothetical protein